VRRFLVLIAACSSPREPEPAPARSTVQARGTSVADSTVAARDYIGPDACGECHPDEHARWRASLHAVMNQRTDAAVPRASAVRDDSGRSSVVIGDFSGVTLGYAGGTARFQRAADGGHEMVLVRGDRTVRYRVTRTIGRARLQEYVGVAADVPEGVEVRLPFGWWPRRGGWYPQPYFDPWLTEDGFDAYAPVREPWAERCPWCHSTYPFELRIARATAHEVGHGFEQFFIARGDDEAEGGPDSASTQLARLDVARQVTVGISCESCHLGGRAHAAGAPIHLVPIGAVARAEMPVPAPTTFAAERADPAIANRVCAQCHSGPSPRFPDGAATRNSSEALDLEASACRARCVDCHDPHLATARDVTERSLAACTGCHAAYAVPSDAALHAGHPTTAASCLDCHMPPVVLGIDRHVRTHRISSPSHRRMLAAGAPNACNLCHLDRSPRWAAAELVAGFESRLDPRALDDRPAGELWLTSDQPALRLIAAAAYARQPELGRLDHVLGALPAIARLADDPLPHVRVWAVFALEDLLGRRLDDAELDPRLPAAERRRQLARLKLGAPSTRVR
jgi:predicted CXXCH cytochrome family protein